MKRASSGLGGPRVITPGLRGGAPQSLGVHPGSSTVPSGTFTLGCLSRPFGDDQGGGPRSRYAPGARYWTCSALRRASIVSSTVRRTVVSSELSAPPPLIASATAAMDTLSGASQRV